MTSTGQAEPIILDTRRTSSSLQNPHKVAYSTNTRRGLRAQSLSHVQLFVTPWAAAHQAPLAMGFSGQEYYSELHAFLQGIFPTQILNLCLLQVDSLPLSHQGSLI